MSDSTAYNIARAVCLLVALGCASRTPPSGIPPASPSAPARIEPPRPTPAHVERWHIASAGTTTNYTIESRTVVSARADSLARVDTLVTRTTAHVTPRGAAVDVTVSAYTVQPASTAPRELAVPARAVGRFGADGGVAFEGAGRATCATMAQTAIESTRDLWVKWPTEVSVGDRWRDSASVAICRDNLPLQLTITRDYRVTGVTGDSATAVVSIDRRSTLRVSGFGPIRGDTVTVAGSGTGTATFTVAAATGWIVDGHATSTLRLTTRSPTRTQIVDQVVTQTFRETAR